MDLLIGRGTLSSVQFCAALYHTRHCRAIPEKCLACREKIYRLRKTHDSHFVTACILISFEKGYLLLAITSENRKLQTNLDTDFLKLIAIISMVIDHVGGRFFPEYPAFRWLGRMAFPIFCYCLTVGMLYTHDIKRYLGRLAAFAFISQPFWILASQPYDILNNLTNMNIFFTLFISLLTVWAFKEHKWWLFAVGSIITAMFNFDYSYTGIILMLIFYLCRNRPALGACLFVLTYLPAAFNGYIEDPLSCVIAGHAISFSFFSILAAPLIFLRTNVNLKIPKYFFYAFYPAHLFLIFIGRMILHV